MPLAKSLWFAEQYRSAGHNFWISGDAIFVLRLPDLPEIALHAFGVRFDPEDIAELIPERATPTSGQDHVLAGQGDSRSQQADHSIAIKLPVGVPPARAVAPAQIKRWYEFFKKIYPPELQNEPNALNHARVTFPKNTVSRQSLRNLRGPQKTGRRPSAEFPDDSAE